MSQLDDNKSLNYLFDCPVLCEQCSDRKSCGRVAHVGRWKSERMTILAKKYPSIADAERLILLDIMLKAGNS